MPHTLLFNLRSGKKSGARASDMVAQVETRNAQAMVGVPGKQQAQNKEKPKNKSGSEKEKERFALEEQAPVGTFVPRGINALEDGTQTETENGQAGNMNVPDQQVIVEGRITRDMSGGLVEDVGIAQLLASEGVSLGIAQNQAEGGVDNNPAAVDEDFSDDVIGEVLGT